MVELRHLRLQCWVVVLVGLARPRALLRPRLVWGCPWWDPLRTEENVRVVREGVIDVDAVTGAGT